MSVKRNHWLILGLFITMLLAGCRCDNSVIPTYMGILDSPADGELVSSLSPTFNWHGSSSCEPDEYNFHIDEDEWNGSPVAGTNISPSNLPYTYTGGNLLPGRSYTWRVMAINGATEDDPYVFGPDTELGQFFTGPVCSGETLIAPQLEYPRHYGWPEEYDDWLDQAGPQDFHWSYSGGCLPISYDYQFATDSGFTDIVLSGTTTEPYVQHLDEDFPSCSTLFWRVAANDGVTVGPWSDTWSFHRVTDESCWQNHYISDNAARIAVWLYHDVCAYTGDPAGMRLSSTGCKVDKNGVTLVGDGVKTHPPDFNMGDFEVDLGSGPCPSTGLDHKTSGWYIFNVLAPGTYCVSVTRNQIIDYGSKNLMHGIWTDPRTDEQVAYKTIEVAPGTSDVIVEFGWDEYESVFLMPRLPETKYCRICPDPIGPVVDILREGSLVELFGRDRNSEWKLTYAQGVPCYLWLMDEKIDLELSQFEDFGWRAQDLEFYPESAPCPKPETQPAPGPAPEAKPKACSEYTDPTSCRLDTNCLWKLNLSSPGGYCTDK